MIDKSKQKKINDLQQIKTEHKQRLETLLKDISAIDEERRMLVDIKIGIQKSIDDVNDALEKLGALERI